MPIVNVMLLACHVSCCRRKKLPLIRVKQLQKLIGPDCPPDTLVAVCLLASWNPVCTKLEHYQLQAAHWELLQQTDTAAQQSSSSFGRPSQGGSNSTSRLGAEACHIQVRASEALPGCMSSALLVSSSSGCSSRLHVWYMRVWIGGLCSYSTHYVYPV